MLSMLISRFLIFAFVASAFAYEPIDVEPELPKTWFWGDVAGKNYLTRIATERAPNYCKSSWAVSTAAAVSSRFNIRNTENRIPLALSPQVLLNCAANDTCSGDHLPDTALLYIQEQGLPHDSCQNYEGKQNTCDGLGICRNCIHGIYPDFLPGLCEAVKIFDIFKIESYGTLEATESDEIPSMTQRMQEEIFANGPITCTLSPSPEFVEYKDGILSGSDEDSDRHYVNILGWDLTTDTPYWIGQNCWGEFWGTGGFFKIQMGVNALGIESQCFWGQPLLEQPPENASNEENALIDRGLYRIRKHPVLERGCDCVRRPIAPLPKPQLSHPHVSNIEIPESYDIRNIDGKNFATVDKNQHIPTYCGSCWAFAPSSALADRFAFLYGQPSPLLDLSTQVLVNCCPGSNGCRGGWPYDVYEYIMLNGIPHEHCAPYQAVDQECTAIHTCQKCNESHCEKVPNEDYWEFGVAAHAGIVGKEMLQTEILTGGPIACLCAVTDEFAAYAGGIFNDSTAKTTTSHVVEVAGWGEEDGIPYWIVRNSWGTYWGENGWARIAMGPGELGLSQVWCDWATPKVLEGSPPYERFFSSQPAT